MNDYRKKRCIDIAKTLIGEKSGRCLHVSFILKNNKILVYAVNDYRRRHPEKLFGKYVPTKNSTGKNEYIAGVHSEIGALKEYLYKFGDLDMSKLTLFNIRLNGEGEVKNSKPCRNCQRVLEPLNFKEILWT